MDSSGPIFAENVVLNGSQDPSMERGIFGGTYLLVNSVLKPGLKVRHVATGRRPDTL